MCSSNRSCTWSTPVLIRYLKSLLSLLLLFLYQTLMYSNNLAKVGIVKVAIAIVVVLTAIATTVSPAIADLIVIVVAI